MGSPPSLDQLLADPPQLHHDSSGVAMSMQLRDDVLRFIEAKIGPASATLETGEGLSTVVFALQQARHTCVGPDFYVHESIRTFCAAQGISLETVTFEVGLSQDVLPRLDPTPLDLVLIDGGHAFPIPFVDWLYTAARLRVGGYLLIDDVQIWTGAVLRGFLASEVQWELVKDFDSRSAAFRKVSDRDHVVGDWTDQPFVGAASKKLARRRKVAEALRLLASGDLKTFAARLRASVRRPM